MTIGKRRNLQTIHGLQLTTDPMKQRHFSGWKSVVKLYKTTSILSQVVSSDIKKEIKHRILVFTDVDMKVSLSCCASV